MVRFSATAGAILVVVLVSACSSSSPSAQPSSGEEPSVAASADASTSPVSLPSYVPGAGDLDSILPDSVAGITLEYQFTSGAGILGGEGIVPEAQAFLEQVHADASDLSSAVGFGVDQATGSAVSIFALRVAGAEEGVLRDGFRQVMEQQSSIAFVEQTVGGKQVLAVPSEGTESPTYLYVHDDVIFILHATPVELAAEMLSLLP